MSDLPRYKIIDEILQLRAYQADSLKMDEFDKSNSRNDWIAYTNAYTGRAAEKVARNEDEGQEFRQNMLKAASLCLAALEAHDRGWC